MDQTQPYPTPNRTKAMPDNSVDDNPVSLMDHKQKEEAVKYGYRRLLLASAQYERVQNHAILRGHLEHKMPRLAQRLRDLGETISPVPGEVNFK